MNADSSHTIATLPFHTSQPTTYPIAQLFTWVIWQFPQKTTKGYYGAIHSPEPESSWIPAIINTKKERVIIHAHLNQQFESPEQAADYLKPKP
jgi:hypothetical protein